MAEGSSQTIDRVQVEFSADVKDLLLDLKNVETQTGNTTTKLSQLESKTNTLSRSASDVSSGLFDVSASITTVTSSVTAGNGAVNSFSEVVERANGYTTSFTSSVTGAAEGILSISDASEQATDSLEGFSKISRTSAASLDRYYTSESTAAASTKYFTETTKSASGEMKTYRSTLDEVAKEVDDAGEKTDEAAKKVETTTDKFKKLFDIVKKIGTTIAASTVISTLVGQVEKLKTASEEAAAAYGKLHNQIFYNIGELTDSQRSVAETLMEKGFGESDVAEVISKVAVYYPNAENIIDENGESLLQQIAEELLWMDRKGLGDASTLMDPMNTAFKRFGITQDTAIEALSYTRAASQDTGISIEEILEIAASMDEMAEVLNLTYTDVVDLIANANVSGDLQYMRGVGSKFETRYDSSIATAREALLAGDLETLTDMGISAEKANSLISQVGTAMEKGAAEGTEKAKELATAAVKELFLSVFTSALNGQDKEDLSEAFSMITGLEVGRVTEALADFALASNTSGTDIRYTNRQNPTPLTTIVTEEHGLGLDDAEKQNAAHAQAALQDLWIGGLHYNRVMTENAYVNTGDYNGLVANALGWLESDRDVLSMYNTGSLLSFSPADLLQLIMTAIINAQGVEDTQVPSVLEQLSGSVQDMSDDFYDLFFGSAADEVRGPGTFIGTLEDAESTIIDTITGVVQNILANVGFGAALSESARGSLLDMLSAASPIGVASAADEVVFDQSLNGLDSGDTAKNIEDVGKAAEEAMEPVQTFTTDASDPLGTSIGTVMENIAGVLEQDTKYQEGLPDLQESLGNETTSVNNLAAAYWNLAAAKAAAGSA